MVIVGAGASALDLAVALLGVGARVRLVTRQPLVKFHGRPRPRTLRDRIAAPMSGLGPGWKSRLCTDAPLLFHAMPEAFRIAVVRRHLGPAACWFTRDAVEGRVEYLLERSIAGAQDIAGRVRLGLRREDGGTEEVIADHVIAATGYRVDLTRLAFLPAALRDAIRLCDSSPALRGNFESSVPGLYFVGAAAANSFGPLSRFVFGADFTATRLAAHLGRSAPRSAPARGRPPCASRLLRRPDPRPRHARQTSAGSRRQAAPAAGSSQWRRSRSRSSPSNATSSAKYRRSSAIVSGDGTAAARRRVRRQDAVPQPPVQLDAKPVLDLAGHEQRPGQVGMAEHAGLVVDGELRAPVVIDAEEPQHPQIFPPRRLCQVVEQDRQHALRRHGAEQAFQLGAEGAGLAVEQAPPRPTESRQPFAAAAFALQVPGGAEVADVLVPGEHHLGMQRRRHLDRVAQHDDEARLRLAAQDVGDGDRGGEIPDRRLADRRVRVARAGEQARVGHRTRHALSVIGVKKMRFLDRRHEHRRVRCQPRRQGRRAAFRRAEDEKVRAAQFRLCQGFHHRVLAITQEFERRNF